MTSRPDHPGHQQPRALVNRRYDPGRYRLIDHNSTPDGIPTHSSDDAPVNRPHNPHRMKGTP